MKEKIFLETFEQKELELNNIGKVLKFEVAENKIVFSCENGYVTIMLYENNIMRFFISKESKDVKHITPSVIQKSIKINNNLTETNSGYELELGKAKIVISKEEFGLKIIENENIVFETQDGVFFDKGTGTYLFAKYSRTEKIYGFGEKAGPIDKRGERIMMWNTDIPLVHNQRVNELYQSHPIFISKDVDKKYGMFLDNPGRTIFDFKEMGLNNCNEKDRYYVQTFTGDFDFYIYLGEEIKDIVKNHTYLTGPSFLPPIWALSYQQASWKYESEEQILEVVKEYRRRDFPIDVIYFDITYMDGYRVFTHDKEKFKNIKDTIRQINEMGVKVITIVDPGIKQDGSYSVFKDAVNNEMLCCYEDGKIFIGPVWPGDSVFPDFTEKRVRDWWGEQHKFYKDLGVAGIWNDMNEPAVFAPDKAITMPDEVLHKNDGNVGTHKELHNIYGFNMTIATYEGLKKLTPEERPFIVGRAGYPGVQRYSAVWTGDNSSLWEHLELTITMGIGLSLSGISYFGPDAGGFNFDATGELMARWFQLGSLTPFFRNHYILNSKDQEPWNFEPEYEAVMKKYVEFRYKILPYIYNVFKNHVCNYDPIVRPIFYNYPEELITENMNDQFMVGDSILVAPITKAGKLAREVYLPNDIWVDYWTKERLEGGKFVLKEAPIDIMPMYIKDKSVIPTYPVRLSTDDKIKEITFEIYMFEDGSFDYTYVEDDGVSSKVEEIYIKLDLTKLDNEIQVKINHNGDYCPQWETINIKYVGAKAVKVLENSLEKLGKNICLINS